MTAAFAFPDRPRRQLADIEAAAARAIGLAVVVRPSDALKRGRRLIVRHAGHGAQGERPGGCGKEEVLRHDHLVSEMTISQTICLSIGNYRI